MKKTQPFMPLFVGDFFASTAEWRYDECGLYMMLLAYQWSLGSLPADPDDLCTLVRCDDRIKFGQLWRRVSTKFVVRDGRLLNERLEAHRVKADQIAKRNAKSGKKGGIASQRKQRSERLSAPEASALASANASALADVSKALQTIRAENEASASDSLKGSLKQSNPIQSTPNLRVLSRGENLG